MKTIQEIPLKFWLAALGCALSSIAYAIQPLNEQMLAEAVGDQSPIEIRPLQIDMSVSAEVDENQLAIEQNNAPKMDAPQTSLDEYLSRIENQIIQNKIQMISQPLQALITRNEDKMILQAEISPQTTQKSIIPNNFGIESVRMVGDGRFETRINLEKIGDFTYDHATGGYELTNVRGEVLIVTTIE